MVTALALSIPAALALAGGLLPGDPDDPDTKAPLLAALVAIPAVLTAGAVALVALWARPGRRCGFLRTVGPATALLTGTWLLLLALPVSRATPAPETKAQRADDAHLWAPGAWRMAAAGTVLVVASLLGGAWAGRRPSPQPIVEDISGDPARVW